MEAGVDRLAEDGTGMKEVILKQPGKVGNIAVEEEAGTMIPVKKIIRDLHAAVVDTLAVAEVGTAMKKDILKLLLRDGNTAVEEEVVTTIPVKTIIKDPHAVSVKEAVIMMKMMTITTQLRGGALEEVATTTKTKTITKDLGVVAVDVAVDTTMMITSGLQVVAEAREVEKAGVGMATKNGIPRQLCKAGNNAVEAEAAAATMTMTPIKGLYVAAEEVHAVARAGDGMAMKENIPAQPARDGEIAISFC